MLQALNFASVLASGLMIYKGLGLVTNTESPIVVVLRCVISSLGGPPPRAKRLCSNHIAALWSPHFTAGTSFSLSIRQTRGTKLATSRSTRSPDKTFPSCTEFSRHTTSLRPSMGPFLQTNLVGSGELTVTLPAVSARECPAPKTSYYLPRGTTTTSMMWSYTRVSTGWSEST